MTIERLLWLPLAVGTALIISVPQPVQALSLACCTSLDEMEQSSDLIIRGQALLDIDDVEKLHFSEAEWATHIATGKALPPGVSVVVHDEKWQFVTGYTTLPVKVLAVIEGETQEQVISVGQNDDWGATPMVKDAEYLLFLGRSLYPESKKSLYFDFYGQGKYNTDRTDLTTGSAGYYNVEEVKERYGDRVDFIAPPLLERVSRWLSKGRETVVALLH